MIIYIPTTLSGCDDDDDEDENKRVKFFSFVIVSKLANDDLNTRNSIISYL